MVVQLPQLTPISKTCKLCLHSASSQSLACVGGLTTTVLPAMSAGAILLTARFTGSANVHGEWLECMKTLVQPLEFFSVHTENLLVRQGANNGRHACNWVNAGGATAHS